MNCPGLRVGCMTWVAIGLAVTMGCHSGGNSSTSNTSAAIVSAHRGGAAYAPENTMPAFRNAVRLGADQIETDTQLSSDGTLVLLHDDTLERTTNCTGSVTKKTLAELQQCDAAYWWSPGQGVTKPDNQVVHPLRGRSGRSVRIPTARALFSYVASLGQGAPVISIEIKDIPGEANFDASGKKVAAKLVPLIRESGLEERTIVQSFWPPALEEVKRLDPEIRTQYLSLGTTGSTGITARQNLDYIVKSGQDISAPNFDAPDFNAPLVRDAHAAGKQVIPYTVDKKANQKRVLGLGVDGLITNWPACTLKIEGRPVSADVLPASVRAGEPSLRLGACPAGPAPSTAKARPSAATCQALRPARYAPATGHADPDGRLRVFAIQYKQRLSNVKSYASFRTAMRCLMEDFVVPNEVAGRPTLVVFNEDIGLMTLGIGSRGATLRNQSGKQASIVTGLQELKNAYSPQISAYANRFGPVAANKQVLLAATDTFARAFSQTFADIARDYGVYVVASNDQAQYRETHDPAEVARFADPDLMPTDAAYVATSPRVANVTMLWGPKNVRPGAAYGKRNLLYQNEKVPLTPLEKGFLSLDSGPATGPAARVNAKGVDIADLRIGFATSLPAFTWGYPFGQRPVGFKPCADLSVSYMPCMDSLGVDVVVQADANPGPWAAPGGNSNWQPLEWMGSSWRTVTDPTVGFRYNITAMLTGNLLDLPFDGQSSITARGAADKPRHYIGNSVFLPSDPRRFRDYAGGKPQFLALAPWVIPDTDRATLRQESARLAPGSADADENNYLETALFADIGSTR